MTLNDGYVPEGEDVVPDTSSGFGQGQASGASSISTPSEVTQAQAICDTYGVAYTKVYTGIGGFKVNLTAAQAQAMAADSRVVAVEPDGPMDLPGTQTFVDDGYWGHWQWGLDALDQTSNTPDYSYTCTNTGTGVNVFVLDTGIAGGHSEFAGRIYGAYNVLDPTNPASALTDNAGHGTLSASLIGGVVCGVAKSVRLYAVKLIESGSYYGNSLDGLKWVLDNYKSYAGRSVMYFRGAQRTSVNGSSLLNKAVNKLLDKAIPVVVPANNYNLNVSGIAPANQSRTIAVGAVGQGATPSADYVRWVDLTKTTDTWNSGSGYGSGIDVFAPGVNVRAAFYSGGFGGWQGTSVAAPLVAGAVAGYVEKHPKATLSAISNWVRGNGARANVSVTNRGSGSPNRFLYLASGGY